MALHTDDGGAGRGGVGGRYVFIRAARAIAARATDCGPHAHDHAVLLHLPQRTESNRGDGLRRPARQRGFRPCRPGWRDVGEGDPEAARGGHAASWNATPGRRRARRARVVSRDDIGSGSGEPPESRTAVATPVESRRVCQRDSRPACIERRSCRAPAARRFRRWLRQQR